MQRLYGTPAIVPDTLFVIAAAVWLLLAAGYAAQLIRVPRQIATYLRDPIMSPFTSLVFIVGMLLTGGLESRARKPAEVLFLACFVPTILLGGWLTGQWIAGQLDQTKLHPGYFLPTVAGGLLGTQGAAEFGLHELGWLSFGIAMLCWLLLGSLILNRLFFTNTLPAALIPTLAIEVAPPAVAGNAYFALHGPLPNTFAYALAGYSVLMVLVQLRLLPIYTRLRFTPGFWAFTFSSTAVTAFAIQWLHVEHPAGHALYADVAAITVSLLVAAITARSLLALARNQLLPAAREHQLAVADTSSPRAAQAPRRVPT